jgi:hypothetical protein
MPRSISLVCRRRSASPMTSRRECFLKLLFEPLQGVRDDVGMQNSLFEAGQELPLEIVPANQKIVLADDSQQAQQPARLRDFVSNPPRPSEGKGEGCFLVS